MCGGEIVEHHIHVVVQSADHISMMGLASCLGARPEITLVPAEERALADVVVVAASELTATVAAELRRAALVLPKPVVLVLDEIGDTEAVTVAECRVVAILPRAAATEERLLSSVLAAAAG